MTYCDGAYMFDQVEYDDVALEIELPEVTSDCIVLQAEGPSVPMWYH